MGKHHCGRLAAIVVSALSFVIILLFNGLAVPGIYPFLTTTGNVSDVFDTQITPSGWTFQIWAVIYTWLIAMLAYILSGLCRKNAYGWVYCSPPVLPYGFFMAWVLNMALNVGWLFVWDRGMMIPALVFLVLVACTNYTMIFFSCHGLHMYGAWLSKYHRTDLWLIRALVQNGIAIYTAWTTIATLINLTIVLSYEAGLSELDAATVSLSILTAEVIGWFVLETFVWDQHVRYIVTIYPVVILATTGNITKNYDPAAPNRNGIFIVVLLSLACVLCVMKFVLVTWRHVKKPLYKDISPGEAKSPMEILVNTKTIFL